MSLETLLGLIAFAFVMSVSPGPSNFLLLASGANFGFLRSLPLLFGITAGFLTMVFLVGLGLGQLLQSLPVVYTALKVVCGAYVLWLAWKIARSKSISPQAESDVGEPISFLQAALFQLVNPKAWAVALIVTVSYTNPQNYVVSLVLMIALFAAVNIPSIGAWAISGVALRRIIGHERNLILFNILMALLLVASIVPVLLGTFG